MSTLSPDTLYDDDIVAWAEQQARAVRELARLRPDLSNAIDWDNIADEVHDVGRSEFNRFKSLLTQFLVHLAKALSVPSAQAREHWLAEALVFRADFQASYTPSMLRRFEFAALWRLAVDVAARSLKAHDDRLASDLGGDCPLSFEELMRTDFDLDSLVARAETRLGRKVDQA